MDPVLPRAVFREVTAEIAASRERLVGSLAAGLDRHRVAGAYAFAADRVCGEADRLPEFAMELTELLS